MSFSLFREDQPASAPLRPRKLDYGAFAEEGKARRASLPDSHKVHHHFVEEHLPSEVRPTTALRTVALLSLMYAATTGGPYGIEAAVRGGGPFYTMLFIFLVPMLWSIPLALCVAELSCAIPDNAGPMMWINCAFSPWFTLSFAVWAALLALADSSLQCSLFADYCGTFFGVGRFGKTLFKIAMVTGCAIVNMVSVRGVAACSATTMLVTLIPFMVLLLLQLRAGGIDWRRIWASADVRGVRWGSFLPLISWNYSGFDGAGHFIEEIEAPERTFSRSVFLLAGLCLIAYVPPILVGASVSSLENVPFKGWENGFWLSVAHALGGPSLLWLVMVGGAVATLGLLNTQIATTSRALAGMGTLRIFPNRTSKWLAAYSKETKTPANAILVTSIVTLALSLLFTFDELAIMDQVLYSVRVIAILAAFVRLRTHFPDMPRPYYTPGGGSGKAAFVFATAPLAYSVFLLITSMKGAELSGRLTQAAVVFGVMMLSAILQPRYRPEGFNGRVETD